MAINLAKETEERVAKIGICLKKQHVDQIEVMVAVAADISGSMSDLYRNGTVQQTLERLYALAVKFDDNGEFESWVFSGNSNRLESASSENIDCYVKNFIMNANLRGAWGGTNYAPCLTDILDFYNPKPSIKITKDLDLSDESNGIIGGIKSLFGFGKKKSEVEVVVHSAPDTSDISSPDSAVYVLFITDGENNDEDATNKIIKQIQSSQVFVQFIGIGTDAGFNYLRDLAKSNSHIDFLAIPDLTKVSDEKLYGDLLNTKFLTFLRKDYPSCIKNEDD